MSSHTCYSAAGAFGIYVDDDGKILGTAVNWSFFWKTENHRAKQNAIDWLSQYPMPLLFAPVDVPGSLSCTVIGTGRPNQGQDLIVSFREKNSVIDSATTALARSIQGCLVPEATYHGKICGLHIYSMSHLQRISSLEALGTKAELTPEAEASHTCYAKHLAR
jgi:hypothetical protein